MYGTVEKNHYKPADLSDTEKWHEHEKKNREKIFPMSVRIIERSITKVTALDIK